MSRSTAAAVELYLYYRAPITEAAAVRAGFGRLQQALREQMPGLNSRLLRRPEPHDAAHTWMEIHVHAVGIDAPREAAIEAAALIAFAGVSIGPRHRERFIACAS
ncbi:MAG: hypothetical protein RLZZ598_966 [Pseudomonadota bacterium]